MSELALLGGTPVRSAPFPAWPIGGPEELRGLTEALDAGIWSSASGPKVVELEQRFAAFQDSAHGIAVQTGTVALEIALAALGIGAGDEVIVPPYTFIASATAVLKINALPVFVDIDPATYCIDPAAVEAAITPRTRAVIAVHLGGHPADMDRLLELKQRHGIAIIEDAAHAHGAAWHGRRVGALGDFGTWSFQASKNMTSGEGGMIMADDPALADRARSLHNCGRATGGMWYDHFELGGNYRLTEFQSALLLAQLARLPQQIEQRESCSKQLDAELSGLDGIRSQARDARATMHAHHLYLFRYDRHAFAGVSRERFVEALNAEGIPASIGYPQPLNCQPLFVNRAFDTRATGYDPNYAPTQYERLDLPASIAACRETVWLYQQMLLGTAEDMHDIITAIRKIQRNASALFVASRVF